MTRNWKEINIPVYLLMFSILTKIPCDVTKVQSVSLGLLFSQVTNLLILKGKGQAFLEMASEDAAVTMVSYYTLITTLIFEASLFIFSIPITENLKLTICLSESPSWSQATSSIKSGNLPLQGNPSNKGTVLSGHSPMLWKLSKNFFYTIALKVLYQVFSNLAWSWRVSPLQRMINFKPCFSILTQWLHIMPRRLWMVRVPVMHAALYVYWLLQAHQS